MIPGQQWQPPIYQLPTPSYLIQTCPICRGKKGGHARLTNVWNDCTFCWGVGAIKVRWWDGSVEAVEPPAEPYWHHKPARPAPTEDAADG